MMMKKKKKMRMKKSEGLKDISHFWCTGPTVSLSDFRYLPALAHDGNVLRKRHTALFVFDSARRKISQPHWRNKCCAILSQVKKTNPLKT